MTKSNLLTPRYYVAANYPGSPFNKGDILVFIPSFMHRTDGTEKSTTYSDVFKGTNNFILASEIDKYPSIFQKLLWWEWRRLEEMPKYVKVDTEESSLNNGDFHKVKSWSVIYEQAPNSYKFYGCRLEGKEDMYNFSASRFLPTSETEYNDFMKIECVGKI